MTSTITNIGQELDQIISNSKSISPELSEEDKVNRFLDGINSFRAKLVERTEKIQKLDKLFSQLTWYDLQNEEEEEVMKNVLSKSLSFHAKSIKNFVAIRKNFWNIKICRDEISDYKNTLDDFEESIYEVEDILFKLRKDDEFNDLMNSL